MESSFQTCKECTRNPVIYCIACLRQYCYQHQNHKRYCDQIIHKVYGQKGAEYQQWLQKTTYFDNILKHHLYHDAIQYLQVLKQHIQSQFTPESRFNAIQALQIQEFFLQSQIPNNTQYCNKIFHQQEFLKQNNDALDIHQYIMLQEGRQHLQNTHRTIPQLNTINFCLYNQQLSTANVAFTSIKQQDVFHSNQAKMSFFQITLTRLINVFPSNQMYRNVFNTIMKPVNIQISQYFKPINFIHFDQFEQTHFLLKIEILIQLLNEQMVSVPDAYRIYNLFEELKHKFNDNVKLKLTSDFLLVKLGVACCKISTIDALNSLQKKKLIATLDSTLEQIQGINDDILKTSCNQLNGSLRSSQIQTPSKSVDQIYYLQHPLYHTFYIVNKNENILKQIKRYAKMLNASQNNKTIRQNVEKVLNFSKVSSQYNMSQLPKNSQFYDEQYQQQYYRSLINQGKLQNDTINQLQKNDQSRILDKDDMTIGDLQMKRSQYKDNSLNQYQSQDNIYTDNLQSIHNDEKNSQGNQTTLAKSKLDILQQQSLVKINQQYINSRLQQHEQQQQDSNLLLQECETMNLNLSQIIAASKIQGQ